jgi:uncharacterized membrane protein
MSYPEALYFLNMSKFVSFWVEISINGLWGGLINGAVYGVLGSMGYLGARSIWRKIKK